MVQVGNFGRLTIDGGGTLTSTAPLENNGLVTLGGGSISVPVVTNRGEFVLASPDAVINASQNFTNSKLLRGGGRVNATLSNAVSGEVRVGEGEHLAFITPFTTKSANAGRINLIDGGALEVNWALLNQQTGVITFSNGGALHASSGPNSPPPPVENAGQILFSAGTSDLFAPLNNIGTAARVIVSGNGTATFHGPLAHDGGEFRVSDGSMAVFFGPVTGTGQFTGSGAKFFEAGQSSIAALATGGDTTVQAPATLSVARLSEDSVIVRGRLDVDAQGGSVANAVNSLAIEGDGVVDLLESDLVIHSDLGTQSAALATVTEYIASARNAAEGRWTGPGLTSSAAAERPLMTLAVGTSGDDVIVRYTHDGDANLDGRVNADDYFRIDSGFLAQAADPSYAQGDFNYDGKINADDYFLIDSAFLGQGEPIAAGTVAAISAVPEPGAAALAALAGLLAMRRRRRN